MNHRRSAPYRATTVLCTRGNGYSSQRSSKGVIPLT